MTTDDFGNVVEATHDLDLEYVYPPKSERICAQDERFASVNEAIGRLEYNLEQHIEKCADGLAPLADFISSSWAVIDELEARIAKLEAAQRPHWLTPPNVNEWIAQNNPPFAASAHPPEGDWAHIPAAEWEAICEELETLRAWKTGIWDRANAVSCPACDSKGGRMEPCVDNPDIWTECRWCNGHGVLYARPKEAGE